MRWSTRIVEIDLLPDDCDLEDIRDGRKTRNQGFFLFRGLQYQLTGVINRLQSLKTRDTLPVAEWKPLTTQVQRMVVSLLQPK